ncbi:MAG: hypothetical protein RMN52_02545 [Anaerolineae bacterium]|nr:hypothetical protein [Candidatus Roseilinea sp.]MDW8448858.1 hypothetical protein [Anaerolineae bacterium]
MTTLEQFEKGLRLDQYIATIAQSKENFRANFIKATEAFSADDLAFFRSLPTKINVAVATEDTNLDALRDVPIIGRLSVEAGNKLVLRLFRPATHADVVQAIVRDVSPIVILEPDIEMKLPIIAFYTPGMRLIGAHVCRLPELSAEMNRRRLAWIESHPEVLDAREPMDKMTPITRTRLTQAMYALTPEQRAAWGRLTVQHWRRILSASYPAIDRLN